MAATLSRRLWARSNPMAARPANRVEPVFGTYTAYHAVWIPKSHETHPDAERPLTGGSDEESFQGGDRGGRRIHGLGVRQQTL
jgi:hypothetical protein